MEAALLSKHAAPKAAPDLRSSIAATFSTAHRLLRGNGFGHVLRAENVQDEYFKIFFVRNSIENARLGIIARKKILTGAVQRNRIKRVVREAFRRHDVKTCKLDMVVMVRCVHSQAGVTHNETLNALFSRVKKRCANL